MTSTKLMRFHLLFFTFLISAKAHAQAVFNSAASGDWDNPSTWTIISGTPANTYPSAGDSVVILNGNSVSVNVPSQVKSVTIQDNSSLLFNVSTASSILTVSNQLLITGASLLSMDAGVLTVTGNMTVNAASSITQNQGLINVLGLVFVTAPTASTVPSSGTSLLNIAGGAFSCAGGVTLTSLANTSRLSELRIGNSSVNIAGSLATTTTNSKINFSGSGLLTLAGLITIPFQSSFVAGTGKVLYLGIPGSNQSVAPLTYYRLAISGFGNGLKQINGTVTVTDSLSLLTDTLIINSGGTLNMNNSTTIVRTAGIISNAPTFLGTVDLVYNDILKDTTGFEMPVATGVLGNLTINDISGIVLAADITVNNTLSLQNGPLITAGFAVNITNNNGGAGVDPAINQVNGWVTGKINRSIGTSTGLRLFPFGKDENGGNRFFSINYTTAPTAAGVLSVQHFNSNAANQSGFPLIDGSVTLVNTAPIYWQADAVAGLSGGAYTLSLTAEGITSVTDYTSLRIIKRPSSGGPWVLDGVAGTNTGSNAIPVVIRNNMAGFSQFTIGGNSANILPLKLLSFLGNISTGKSFLTWVTAQEYNTAYFTVEHSIDGVHFSSIGQVSSNGTSSTNLTYNFTDNHPVTGLNYYRLKQVDLDGQYTLSDIIVLRNTESKQMMVYPTLTNGIITIDNAGTDPILLYNANGASIARLLPGVNNIQSIADGIYFIKSGNNTVRILKQ
ncbi:MAG: hypothetical protein JST86_15005 [Bacteroidetes bacterium]|nr:hypothetical protein [Bacteroidota bacterium]